MVVYAVEQRMMMMTMMMMIRRWKGRFSKKALGTWSKQRPPPTRRQLLTFCTVSTALLLGCCCSNYVPLSSAFLRRSSSPFQGTLGPSPPFPTDGAAAAAHPCGSYRSRSSPSGMMRVGKTTTGVRVECRSGDSFNELPATAVSRARESKVRSAVSRSATTTAATAALPFKAATPSARSPSGSASSSSSSSFLSDAPSPSPQSSSASEQPNIFSKSLKGLLRGHKCLFDDSHLPNGNMSLLFRGADSSQRYVYPLELKTNANQLPGAVAAKVMFDQRDAAIATAREVVFGPNVTSGGGQTSREETPDGASSAFGLRSDDGGAGQLVFEDIARFHRVLQYGVAAGLTRFMRNEVLQYNTDLYAEMGVSLDALIAAMNAFGRFYDKHMTTDQWEKAFNPALQSVVQVMSKMKESISNRPQVGGETELSRSNQMPIAWEDSVDPRTLTSLWVSNSETAGKAAAHTSSVR